MRVRVFIGGNESLGSGRSVAPRSNSRARRDAGRGSASTERVVIRGLGVTHEGEGCKEKRISIEVVSNKKMGCC